MTSERRLSGPAVTKQKRGKSPSNFVVIHDDPENSCKNNNNGNLRSNSPFRRDGPSIPAFNGRLCSQSESSPNLSMDSRDSSNISNKAMRKMSITSTSSDTDIKQGGTLVKRSQTESDISYHSRHRSSTSDPDESFYGSECIYLESVNQDIGSASLLHRPVAIEEELYSKVNQLNSLVLLWRKRWKQQKGYSDLLTKQIGKTEKDCANVINSVKEIYIEKLKLARKDLNKEILDRQKLDRDKKALELLYRRATQQYKKEEETSQKVLLEKSKEIEKCKSLQDEARTHIRDIKKELSKVRRENEKLVKHISKMKMKIMALEKENNDAKNYVRNLCGMCDGNCEYKLLFDLAIQKLQSMEVETDKWNMKSPAKYTPVMKPHSPGYVLKTDLNNPLKMSIEVLESGTTNKHDGDEICSGDTSSDDSVPEQLADNSQDSAVGLSHYDSCCEPSPNSNSSKTAVHNLSALSNPLCSSLPPKGQERNLSISSAGSIDLETFTNSPGDDALTCVAKAYDARCSSTTSESSLVSVDVESSHKHHTRHLECHPLQTSIHIPLRKSLTADSVNTLQSTEQQQQQKEINLARRITWNNPMIEVVPSNSDSGNSSPALSPKVIKSEQSFGGTQSTPISGFEGLRGRRNGIIDMDRDVALQLKFLKQGKKGKDIAGLLKRISFSNSNG